MNNRIVAVVLAISLAGCSSVPRFAPQQPSNPTEAGFSASMSTAETPLTEEQTEQQPVQHDAEDAPKQTDTTRGKVNPLAKIGAVIVGAALIIVTFAPLIIAIAR